MNPFFAKLTESHLFNVLIGVFVTILWSSSFVIIKQWLDEISPIGFAAYRYLIASSILLVLVISNPKERKQFKKLNLKWILILFGYGLVFITLTQGLGFLSLDQLNAITVSFFLNFSTVIIVLLGLIFLKEKPTNLQNILIGISLIGVAIYFLPLDFSVNSRFGLVVLFLAVIANSVSSVVGRSINALREFSSLFITAISMGFGAISLTIVAIMIEGLPSYNEEQVMVIVYLAVFNTAIAFTLWNFVLQKLAAFEASVINNTMLIQITIMAIIFLDEFPTPKEWMGIIIVGLSAMGIQIYSPRLRKSKILAPEKQVINQT